MINFRPIFSRRTYHPAFSSFRRKCCSFTAASPVPASQPFFGGLRLVIAVGTGLAALQGHEIPKDQSCFADGLCRVVSPQSRARADPAQQARVRPQTQFADDCWNRLPRSAQRLKSSESRGAITRTLRVLWLAGQSDRRSHLGRATGWQQRTIQSPVPLPPVQSVKGGKAGYYVTSR